MAGRTWYASRQLFSFGPVTLSPFGIEKKNAHRAIQLTSQRANAKIRKNKKKRKKHPGNTIPWQPEAFVLDSQHGRASLFSGWVIGMFFSAFAKTLKWPKIIKMKQTKRGPSNFILFGGGLRSSGRYRFPLEIRLCVSLGKTDQIVPAPSSRTEIELLDPG